MSSRQPMTSRMGPQGPLVFSSANVVNDVLKVGVINALFRRQVRNQILNRLPRSCICSKPVVNYGSLLLESELVPRCTSWTKIVGTCLKYELARDARNEGLRLYLPRMRQFVNEDLPFRGINPARVVHRIVECVPEVHHDRPVEVRPGIFAIFVTGEVGQV